VVTVDRDEVVCGVAMGVSPVDTDREIADSALNVAPVSVLTVKVTNNHRVWFKSGYILLRIKLRSSS